MLKKILKRIEENLSSLEHLLEKEHKSLLNSDKNNMLEYVKKKEVLFKEFFALSESRLFFEKKYNLFAPYKNNNELKMYWGNIVKKCFILRKLNFKNKIILNKKIYLNQYFLESFTLHKKYITYNVDGNLKT